MISLKKQFKLKQSKDGRTMLNLACGSHMHPEWNNLDFSPITRLAKHMKLSKVLYKCGILSENRFRRLAQVDPEVITWDLRKGIPFDDNTFDVVYHSHFLEHLHRNTAEILLKDCFRVLKPSGIIRVVVPDLSIRCMNYINTFQQLLQAEHISVDLIAAHQKNIHRILDQLIAKEMCGTSEQPKGIRIIERFIRGDSIKGGEIHLWMYDKFTLLELLKYIGFNSLHAVTADSGRIEGWSNFCLDIKSDGSSYKRDSIYIEGLK